MKKLTYFVPVDFSECSYNALQYATMLARFAEGKVVLCHVINLEEITDSENPVVVSWGVDRLERKAKAKMKSLREIIALDDVPVEDIIVMGNPGLELMKQIEKSVPAVVVIGRNSEKKPGKHSMVTYITRRTNIPVLVVPGSHHPQVPNNALLATDAGPDKLYGYAQLYEILQKTSQQLSVVSIKNRLSPQDADTRQWIETLHKSYGITACILEDQQQNCRGVAQLIQANKVDLLCTVKKRNGLLGWIFGTGQKEVFAEDVPVPMLVLNDIG